MKVLMCQPTFFDIEYEINPWMHMENKVDRKMAMKQWQAVYDTYKDLGVEIELIEPVRGLPDMVFTANAGIVKNNIFISGNFRYSQRKGEEYYYQKWFSDHGYIIKTLNHYQGGEGDALFFLDTLYMGYGFRSELQAHQEIKQILGVSGISLKLIDPYFYDFDTAFCPLGDKAVLYYPDALDKQSRELLEELSDAIPVTRQQAENFVNNSVYVNGRMLVGFLDDALRNTLKKLDIEPIFLDMSEFKKSGGGIKCVTLYLER